MTKNQFTFLKENYIYKPEIKPYKPQKEDENKVLIFYNPSCPFCIYFAEKIREVILQIVPEIEVKLINIFEEKDEVEKRVLFTIVLLIKHH